MVNKAKKRMKDEGRNRRGSVTLYETCRAKNVEDTIRIGLVWAGSGPWVLNRSLQTGSRFTNRPFDIFNKEVFVKRGIVL